jgi:hypothetical protein
MHLFIMGKIYYLDLDTLLGVLGHGSYLLTTSLIVSNMPATGLVQYTQGKITGYTVQLSDGRRLDDQQAYRLLRSQEQWQVQFQDPPSLSQLSPALSPSSSRNTSIPSALLPADRSGQIVRRIFRQRQPLLPTHLTGLSMKQRLVLRTVFAMINGERDVESIKASLNLPTETVEEALKSLLLLGVIEKFR